MDKADALRSPLLWVLKKFFQRIMQNANCDIVLKIKSMTLLSCCINMLFKFCFCQQILGKMMTKWHCIIEARTPNKSRTQIIALYNYCYACMTDKMPYNYIVLYSLVLFMPSILLCTGWDKARIYRKDSPWFLCGKSECNLA